MNIVIALLFVAICIYCVGIEMKRINSNNHNTLTTMKVNATYNPQTGNMEITGAPTPQVAESLQNFSAFWTNLTFEGEMNGNTFFIEKVYNRTSGAPLAERELAEAYYDAFCPDNIHIKNMK